MRLRVLFLCGRSTACVPFSIPNTLSGLDQQSPGRLIPFPVSIVSYENYRGETSAAIFIPKARNDRAQGLNFFEKGSPPGPISANLSGISYILPIANIVFWVTLRVNLSQWANPQ